MCTDTFPTKNIMQIFIQRFHYTANRTICENYPKKPSIYLKVGLINKITNFQRVLFGHERENMIPHLFQKQGIKVNQLNGR